MEATPSYFTAEMQYASEQEIFNALYDAEMKQPQAEPAEIDSDESVETL